MKKKKKKKASGINILCHRRCGTLAIRIIDFIFVECMCNIIHWIIYVPLCMSTVYDPVVRSIFAAPQCLFKVFFLFHLMVTL